MTIERTPDNFIKLAKYEKVLEVFLEVGSFKETCRQTGITYTTWKEWHKDPDFQGLLEEAQADVCVKLEREAMRRAVDGVDEPVFYKGKEVATKKKHSDYLLGVLLQANMPQKYRQNVSVDQTGDLKLTHQGAIEQLQSVRVELMSDPRLIELAYQTTSATDPNPRLLCSGSDPATEVTVSDQPSPEAD